MEGQQILMPDFAAAIAAFRPPQAKPVIVLELDPEQAVS